MLPFSLNPPYLTASMPGIGGRIKVEPDDFIVEEIPAYLPSGSGDFLYLWVEKRDLGAEYFQRQIAQRLGIPNGEVGMAGLKDRRAVTRQWISVPATAESHLSALDGDGIRVLQVDRHSNKLRAGHLHGNRFQIRIRDCSPETPQLLPPILEQLTRDGMPNFYGSQRFGNGGETARIGMQLLRNERTDRPVRSPFLRKLFLSAAQSLLFNAIVARRIEDARFSTVLAGDVMMKLPTGGMFTAEDLPTEQERMDRRETVPAAAIFGKKTFPSKGEAQQRELAILQEAGIRMDQFRGFGKLMSGTRRPILVYPESFELLQVGEIVEFRVTLPAGSYATIFLREWMKNDQADLDERVFSPASDRPETTEPTDGASSPEADDEDAMTE